MNKVEKVCLTTQHTAEDVLRCIYESDTKEACEHARSLRKRLIAAYGAKGELTDEEAAQAALLVKSLRTPVPSWPANDTVVEDTDEDVDPDDDAVE